MTLNPYSPPQASLIEERDVLPLPVAASLVLFVASSGVEWFQKYMAGWYTTPISIFGLLLNFLLTFAVAAGLYRRKNWLRWLIIVLLPAGWVMAEAWKSFGQPLSALQTVLVGLQVLLLLVSGSCYGPNNSFKPRPLRGSA